jgi:hypothetical protein
VNTARKHFITIYNDRLALGFIVLRSRRKFEALGGDARSLGLYPTQRKAMTVIGSRQQVTS